MADSRAEPVNTRGGIALPTRIVVFTWIASYFAAAIISVVLLGLVGYGDVEIADQPFWSIALTSLALWLPMLVALSLISNRYGSRQLVRDFALSFSRCDLVGLPIGAACQLLLVPLVTWPFTKIWPDSFSTEKVEQRARDLYDTASGGWIIVLILVVALGAPLVEELMYRGFIQRSITAQIGQIQALIATAIWFAAVHLQIVEFPGLFCFALVLGYLTLKTGRIGASVYAHVAFNATGLLLIATT